MTTFRLESRFQQSIPRKNDRAVKLDHNLVIERLPEVQHPANTSVPVSRNEYLDRRAKLWSLIQGVNPQTANMEEIAAEKAALDSYQGVAIIGCEGVDR